MKIVISVIATLILLGGVCLFYGYAHGAASEWVPVTMPYPGSEFSTKSSFHLYRGGRFNLEVQIPATSSELLNVNEGPPLSADLHVSITNAKRPSIDASIKSFQKGSWASDRIGYNPSDVWELQPGEHQISIISGIAPSLFSQRGAIVRLQRLEDVGPALLFQIAIRVGYFLLLVAFIIAVALSVRRSA